MCRKLRLLRPLCGLRLRSAARAWDRANVIEDVCRDNTRNRRRYAHHINESNRLIRKLEGIGAFATTLAWRK